ncbi:MAG: hypothetical protein LBC40_01480 [Dysgonamonadaceae bacterium]|jgi:hypothetical protein|nr:hypothetical protein [Dysgonamonadaceae bacterium]
MPSTIPYDPSLVLGNIVEQEKLNTVVRIAEIQAPADAAQSELNSLITLKRSIDMTVQEMIDMGINAEELAQESREVGVEISKAATLYGKTKIEVEKAIRPLKAKMSEVNSEIESPIDYGRSKLKSMPISSDSMEMNVQYFSLDENAQSSSSHASSVSAFVSDSLNYFGQKFSSQASSSVQRQVNSQASRHSISGTLVICITCTHKNAQIFSPFIMDVDKAVHAWNKLFPDDMIKTNDPVSIAMAEAMAETKSEQSFCLLSGATYGSSFVGMVHILNTSNTTSSQDMISIAESLQGTFKVGGWFADCTGGFGVNSSFSNSAKNLLSTQNIQSHCSLVTMGIIPSIKSNKVKMTVQQFTDFSPDKEMERLAALQNATASENDTMFSAADSAKTGQQSIEMKSAQIKSVVGAVGALEDGENQIIDINSMMTAMDDYIDKCIAGGNNFGVPVNYYLKPVTKSMIARSWLAKYYPNTFNKAGSADDGNGGGGASGGENGSGD